MHNGRTGLHAFQLPQLPADLAEGYPAKYTKKAEDKPDGIEPVIAGVLQVCTSSLPGSLSLDVLLLESS